MPAGAAAASSDFAERTIAKLRRRIVPLLLLLYFVAYLDRTNIGFAAITMNPALGITSTQFGLLAGIFFWGYFVFEIPSNLLLHRLGARMWIGRILISWGLVAMATGAARTVPQLYGARFLLGLAEAGFFPGIILYLTYWFRQREQAQVISLFAMALPVASILGSPVSGLILDRVHWAGIDSWRWLLILEGLPAIACGILAFCLLPSRPADAAFLTREEKDWLSAELTREERERAGHRPISVLRSLVHPHVWLLVAVLFGFDIGLYAMSFYMPQVVKSLSSGSSNTVVGILVMIPHLAGLIAMILVSRSSDRKFERRYHTAIPLAVAGLALILLGAARSQAISVLLWSFAWMGIYSFLGPFFSIPSRFLAGVAAASGIALINSVGNLGGFFGPSLIGALATQRGIPGALAIAGFALFVPAALVLLLPRTQGSPQRPLQ
ncbi:MAG TPA: MFS transporter [Bryobacteraceae bacterium]|jgi:MFS family permease|nr:MFS transporter [Bryobacteraceae bacterium]